MRFRRVRQRDEGLSLLADLSVSEWKHARANEQQSRSETAGEPSVTVVVPTLNEEPNLPFVLPRIAEEYEVILVDGHSTDRTIEAARSLRADIVIVEVEGRGKGAALRAGFLAATGDVIVAIDADGSTDPAEIPLFVAALMGGADYAKGSRFLPGGGTVDMTRVRRLGNWGFVVLVRFLFGGEYTDLCYGYNAFWRRHVPALDLIGDGFEIETIMNIRALKAGLVIAEVPSFEHARIHGASGLKTFRDGWQVLKTILRERFHPDCVVSPVTKSEALNIPPASVGAPSRVSVMNESDQEGRA